MKFYQEFLGYCSKWNALSSAKQGHFLRSNTCYSVVQVLDPGRVALKVLWSWQLPGLYMDGPGTLVLVRTASLCSDRGGNKVKMSLSLFESSIFFFFFFRKERSAGFLIHRIFCCCCQKGFFFFFNGKLPHSLVWKEGKVFFIQLDMDMVCWECSVGVKEVDQQYSSTDASFFCFRPQGKFPLSAQSVSQCGPPTLGRIENTEQTLFLRMEKQGKVSKNMALYFSPSCKSAVWGSFPSSAFVLMSHRLGHFSRN